MMRKLIFNGGTVIILLSIVYLSLTSRTIVSINVSNIDKVQHGLAYAVLAFFFCLSLRSWGLKKTQFIQTLLFCAILGGILEIVQSRYGRMMEFSDFFADIIGAFAGCFVIFLKDHFAA